jgi:hypothetical protein
VLKDFSEGEWSRVLPLLLAQGVDPVDPVVAPIEVASWTDRNL